MSRSRMPAAFGIPAIPFSLRTGDCGMLGGVGGVAGARGARWLGRGIQFSFSFSFWFFIFNFYFFFFCFLVFGFFWQLFKVRYLLVKAVFGSYLSWVFERLAGCGYGYGTAQREKWSEL